MAPQRIGIIGYGQLGQFLAKECVDHPNDYELVAVWNRGPVTVAAPPVPVMPLDTLATLDQLNLKLDLIVEVAHPSITQKYVDNILRVADYFIGSPTALADELLLEHVRRACVERHRTVYVAAGAFWGSEDVKKMADLGTLTGLTVCMRKHPASFKLESPLKELNAQVTTEELVLFEGTVRALCPLAPNNVNTMATGALAAHTLGFDGTRARLVSDPNLPNAHIVEIDVHGMNGFNVHTRRYNPSVMGAVSGQATFNSFIASLRNAHGKPIGIQLC